MKSKPAPNLQTGIIALSITLIVGAFFFSFSLAAEVASTNVLQDNFGSIKKVAVPVDYETRVAKGDRYFSNQDYSLAANEYAFAINIQPAHPEAYIKIGLTYLETHENNKSLEQFKRAMDLDPSNPFTKAYYGLSLARTGQHEEAKTTLESISGDHQEKLYFLSLVESQLADYDNAEKHVNRAAQLEGSLSTQHVQLFQNAFQSFEQQLEGQDIYLQALLSEAMVDAQEYELAEALSLKTLNAEPNYRDVWNINGYAKLKLGDYENAEDAFKQAKNIDASKPETHYFLATTHFFQEEYAPSIDAYELALLYGFQPEVEAYRKIAESHLFLEQYEDALNAYEHVVNIDPANIDTFVKPVWISIDVLGDLDRALTLSKGAVEFFPSDAMSHNLLAWTYLERGELDAAEKEVDFTLHYDSKLPAGHYNKGLLKEARGETESAINSYARALELAPIDDSIYLLSKERYDALNQALLTPISE